MNKTRFAATALLALWGGGFGATAGAAMFSNASFGKGRDVRRQTVAGG
jgi:hypothetical protein